jgi:16S rRNA G1207 methylase RsmC
MNIITESLRGFDIQFMTRPGVFSTHGTDSGTRILIDKIEVEDRSVVADLGSGLV